MTWTAYGGESETGPFPIPATAPIEGGAAPTNTGDRHVLVIDRDNDRLYELFNATCNADGSWDAACGALFHLDSNNVRPAAQPGWTSADAAGLPIFPGSRATKKPRSARAASAMRCASRCSGRAAPTFRRPRTGPRRTPTRPCRRWGCASA
jgi:hypothetical protein